MSEERKEQAAVSRREFLRMAGIAGATIGVGAGLGGFVAACGSTETTTTTVGATTTSAATSSTEAVTTTAASASTTVTTAAQLGRAVKIGVTTPKTGIYAAFAEPMNYLIDGFKKAVADGVVLGDGQKHPVELVVVDTQSDSARAAQVAGDLVSNSKVDLVFSSGSPDNVLPVVDQCEALGTPSLSVNCPWEPFVFGRGGAMDKAFQWTYLACQGVSEFIATDVVTVGQLPTNKKVGLLFANTADGQAWSDSKTGYPPALKAAGYATVMPDLYPAGLEDFSSQISQFKKEGCDICLGTPSPAELTNFWKQALQQSYNPKILLMGLPLLFPAVPNSIGASIYNACCEITWSPAWPYKSSITGQTAQELADDYEKTTGIEWSMVLGSLHSGFEWALDVLKRATNLDDKQAIMQAVKATKLNTVTGLFDLTIPLDPGPGERHPQANVIAFPCTSGQWVKGKKWPFEVVQIASPAKDLDSANTATLQPMQYS